MARPTRVGLLVGGALSFGLGSAATFATGNEAGTAALITVGALSLVLGARGTWPLSVGADGIDWEAQARSAAGQASRVVEAAARAGPATRAALSQAVDPAEAAVDDAALAALLTVANTGARVGFSAARAGAGGAPQMVAPGLQTSLPLTWTGLTSER